MTELKTFEQKAVWMISRLLMDFPGIVDVEFGIAAAGNGGHESMGLQPINEKKPLVAGSAGGFSWFQWTGIRRRAFEAFSAKYGLDIRSDEAAYRFLVYELRTTEKQTIPMVMKAVGLEAKVKAFELGFERAHKDYKHYPSRVKWAKRAKNAWDSAHKVQAVVAKKQEVFSFLDAHAAVKPPLATALLPLPAPELPSLVQTAKLVVAKDVDPSVTAPLNKMIEAGQSAAENATKIVATGTGLMAVGQSLVAPFLGINPLWIIGGIGVVGLVIGVPYIFRKVSKRVYNAPSNKTEEDLVIDDNVDDVESSEDALAQTTE